MTCEDLAETLEAYVAGELDPSRRSGLEQHTRSCPECRRYLGSYLATIDLCRRGAERESNAKDGDVSESLVRRILEARRRHGD